MDGELKDLRSRGALLIKRARENYTPLPACGFSPDKHYWHWRKYFDPRRDGLVPAQRAKNHGA